MRQANPIVNKLLCGVQLWHMTWVDSMLVYWRDKTKELRFNAHTTKERLENEGREFKRDLELSLKFKVDSLTAEIE